MFTETTYQDGNINEILNQFEQDMYAAEYNKYTVSVLIKLGKSYISVSDIHGLDAFYNEGDKFVLSFNNESEVHLYKDDISEIRHLSSEDTIEYLILIGDKILSIRIL